ncbi:MAG: hypothetical protein VX265_09400, partial [Myxococcota bacterium]|nr:hypothetical protein [Myxococcota bacterium]MEC8422160.1 hypothetical protein [Myxococcota bacterium]
MVPRIVAISPPRAGPWVDALADLHGSGVDAIILRLLETPGDLPGALAAARKAGLRVFVRPVLPGDADAAIAEGAGLHLPDHGPPARRGAVLTSTSCHDAGRVVQAADARLDFCTLAPVFSPGSKPGDTRPVLGLAGLRAATREAPG